jgi:nucleotide-binding universal stress UspA family protein
MIEIKRILVPTDFSDSSAKALAYGNALARQFGSSLEILHVIEAGPFAGAPPAEGYVAEMPGFATALEKAARASLARQAETAACGVPATQTIRWGRPHVEIAQHAKEREVDLIVMGTHGRGLVAHLLLGSVAERLVRSAPCPVLTVREREHDFVQPDAGLRTAAAAEASAGREKEVP